MSSNWIKDALFYEIYPVSYKDSNGDGLGDLKGIIEKLDYFKEVGFNAIWLNPFYKSTFKDGGYDVTDFFKVDRRYGSMKDFEKLLKKAHDLDIKIIIDLIPGHTSEEHPLFLESAKAERNEYSDMFIWNANIWDYERPYILISGRHPRNGSFMVNYFSHQPALNYGFNRITHPNWQLHYTDPRTFKTRQLIKDVMKFWMSKGVDGFRVDMADSLVKNDEEKTATIEVWQDIIGDVKKEYPDIVLVSEWAYPERALKAGFTSDFVLDHRDNFTHYLARSTPQTEGLSVLDGGDQRRFIDNVLDWARQAKEHNGYISMISGNHDCPRIATFQEGEKLNIFYMMMYTLPGVPFLYYGDEIGMKHRNLASKEGGYQRTGDRTPMQWDNSKNRGFSTTDGELYLPVDDEKCNVEEQLQDPDSLLNFLKELIKVRKEFHSLSNNNIRFEYRDDNVLVYERDEIYVIVNLSGHDLSVDATNVVMSSSKNALTSNILKNNSAIILRK